MKPPASYNVGLQRDSRPGFTADRVVPRENPNAQAAQQQGEALAGVGLGVLRINEVLTERLDHAKASEADSKIADGYREILNGPKGYQTLLGRNATDAREDTVKAIDEHRRRVLDALSPRQRQLAADSDSARYQHARLNVDSHYTRQLSVYEQGQTEARAEGLMQDVTIAATDPAVKLPGVQGPTEFEDKRSALRGTLTKLAGMRGYSDEETTRLLEKADDNIAGAVVGQFLDPQNPRAREAAKFLADYGEGLSAKARASMQKAIAQGGEKEQAQQIMTGLLGENLSMPAMLAKLDSMGLPQGLADEAERRVLHRASVLSASRDAASKAVQENARGWQAAHPNEQLPAPQRDQLRASGEEAAFDLWKLKEGKFDLSSLGLAAQRLDDKELLAAFPTADAVVKNLTGHMSDNDLTATVKRYKKAAGEALTAGDKFLVDYKTEQTAFLNRQQFFDVKRSPEETGRMLAAFESSVSARMSELAKEKSTAGQPEGVLRAAAMSEVWAAGGKAADGEYLPGVMRANGVAVTSYADPATGQTITAPGGEPITSGHFNPESALSSVAYDADGNRIRMSGAESDGGLSFAQASASLKAGAKMTREPTEPEVAAYLRDHFVGIAQRTAAAKEAASLENRLRVQHVVHNLGSELIRDGNQRYQKAVKNWETSKKASEAAYAQGKAQGWRSLEAEARAERSVNAGARKPTLQEAYAAAATTAEQKYKALFASVGITPGHAFQAADMPAEVVDLLRGSGALFDVADTIPDAPRATPEDWRAKYRLSLAERQRLEDLRASYAKTQPSAK